jgi:cold shock CspA family protein
MIGTMLWFNEAKDHGYISTEEGERLYVEGSGFVGGARPKGRCAGLAVSFQVSANGDRKAEEVALVDSIAPPRARRRHGGGRARG